MLENLYSCQMALVILYYDICLYGFLYIANSTCVLLQFFLCKMQKIVVLISILNCILVLC
jgi:hypothetical protein